MGKPALGHQWVVFQWVVPSTASAVEGAQFVAQQLPVANLLEFPDFKQAVLQWVGHTLEQHESASMR